MSLLSKIFGDANERYINSLKPVVEEINKLEPEFEKLSDAELRDLTQKFRSRLGGETLDDILPEVFAAVREAAKRTLKQRQFDVQLIGGMVLHQGKIAEMKTGEGKTLVATLPLYLNSLAGYGAHLVTPNDYLSRVGAGWMGVIYHALGVKVGVIAHEWSGVYDPEYQDSNPSPDDRLNHFRPVSRREAYAADITYGTNNEFGFDYLRDNLEYSQGQLRQRDFHYAIVDEVDSILIDEARTPLIISAPDAESADLYKVFSKITPHLQENSDYNVDEKLKAVSITEQGIDKVEKMLGMSNIYEERGMRFVRYLESALRAKALFQRDKDYVVRDGQVIIVDEFTGRLMPGRRWSEGLHQAIEAKEGVQIQQESRTLATVTFQNYFRMYKKLAGMTGTAQTSAEEFHKVYNLDVITVPTHRPMIREDKPDLVFRTERGKFQAVVREIKERHQRGQPVLVGTASIEKNEKLAKMLSVEGIKHEVLNAKNHEREALIIAQAGRAGAVTIATNMAGRGVDIILGGTDEGSRTSRGKSDFGVKDEVRALGGLYVIGTERHEARRIDNQLRGRAGRQGDPGCSQFFVSLEDDLMRIFASEKIKRMMETLGIPEDQPIENKMVSRAIEAAQSKIEGFHFDSRKHVLEYDDVLNKQRDAIYRLRKSVLFASVTPKERIFEMLQEEITKLVEFHTQGDQSEWNLEEVFETVKAMAGVPDEVHKKLQEIVSKSDFGGKEVLLREIIDYLLNVLRELYDEREKTIGPEGMRNIERAVLLRSIDMLWMDHLDQMEHLRDSVRLRAYGQRDPLVEYKNEGVRLFRELQNAIRSQIVSTIFKIEGAPVAETSRQAEGRKPEVGGIRNQELGIRSATPQNSKAIKGLGIGRNDPCPCKSGRKYKRCHGIS